ncbi:MAG TPA: COR domain-containing protein [Pyrinomonadaceae bacterium]|jgi:internalin A
MADKHSEGYREALARIKQWEERNNESETLELQKMDLTNLPKALFQLKNLRSLWLFDNQLSELPKEIGELEKLEILSLFNNKLVELPDEISKLKNLWGIALEENQLNEIPKGLLELKNLEEIHLGNNQITSLPKEIAQLTNLQRFFLRNNKISQLPKEINQLKKLNILSLEGNQLNLPPEIVKRRGEPKVILNYYFENVLGKERPLNEIKMLLLGEGTVGKTALVNRLVFDKFETTEKTEGIDIHKWNVEIKKNCNIQINIWDFAGQEITHATHQFFLTKRSLYLLVLASRQDEKANRLEEWLKLIQNLGGESPVIIVCNKSDEHQMNLDERALREKYPNIREIIKVSCKKGTNIKKLKQIILKEIKEMPHVFEPFSKKWFAVKQKLENLKENYIPFEDYLKICKRQGVTKDLDRETLIKFLHDLGVVLNFRDDRRLNDTNVLKPEWITEGVYKILTSKMLDDKHGVLDLEMVEKILDNRRYPKHKHLFIVQMMQKFERCFPLKPDEIFLVPDLLPKQEPDFSGWKPQENGLGFQYHYEIEPASFITRFIVNMNEYIDGETYWRKGVVLKNGKENRALVKADLEDKKIFIWIDGKMETRRGFLSIIRRQFEKIHQTMSNLKVIEYAQHEKGLILYESLLKLEEKGIKKHYFPDIDAEIDVTEMLNGFETPNERWSRANRRNEAIFKSLGHLPIVYQYDVALSFAGEDRKFVREVYAELKRNEVSVFYDDDEDINIDLWGKELVETLDDVYRKRTKFVVVFISESYVKKVYTKLESKSALANALNEKREYVLPARFDDTELPGLLPTLAFVDLTKETPQSFAQKIIRKLGKL